MTKSCEDTISRQAAIEAIKDLESSDDFGFNNGLICSMNRIAELPSAQPEQKAGNVRTVMTNADHIRAMTDADLANFINEAKIDGLLRKHELPTSAIDWLDWLKQEAEE